MVSNLGWIRPGGGRIRPKLAEITRNPGIDLAFVGACWCLSQRAGAEVREIKMRKFFVVLATAVMLLVVPVGSVEATPPSQVNFEVVTSIGPFGDASGPFVASGPAVDSGLMCASGETVGSPGTVTGFNSQAGINIKADKLFICDDGSGEFVLKLQVRIDHKGDNFNWNVVDGSGDYANLHGSGSGIGIPICGPDCVVDIFDGGMHID